MSLNAVSTHAPRAGRDIAGITNGAGSNTFQPTRPVRGATA